MTNRLGATFDDRARYLSTDEAARYTGRPSREAFIRWARRHHIPLRRPDGGRVLSARVCDLDAALAGVAVRRRHRQSVAASAVRRLRESHDERTGETS